MSNQRNIGFDGKVYAVSISSIRSDMRCYGSNAWSVFGSPWSSQGHCILQLGTPRIRNHDHNCGEKLSGGIDKLDPCGIFY